MHFKNYIVLILFVLSCDDLEYNPFDESNNPDFEEPDTYIITDLEGFTLDTSSVSISWEGNALVSEFSYKLNDNEWSGWGDINEVTLNYLDEGEYFFYVKGRYVEDIEDETPDSVSFIVDAVRPLGIRIYNLYNETTLNDNIQVSIYAEELSDIIAVEFYLYFDGNILSYNGFDNGDLLNDMNQFGYIIDDLSSHNFRVSLGLLNENSLNGTGSIIKINFLSQNIGMSNLIISDPIFRTDGNYNIPVSDIANGMVLVK